MSAFAFRIACIVTIAVGAAFPAWAAPADELSLVPATPQAGERITIEVPGLACYNSQPIPLVEAVHTAVKGSRIAIEMEQWGWSCFSAGDPLVDKPYAVDIGTLPSGAYCVDYTRRMAGSVNLVRQLSFAVGIPFTARNACELMVSSGATMWTLDFVSLASNTKRFGVPLPSGTDPAFGTAISQDGRTGYLIVPGREVSPMLNAPWRELVVIDIATAAITKQFPLPDYSSTIVVAPDARITYVDNTAVSLVDGTLGPTGNANVTFTSPGGTMVYGPCSGGMCAFDARTMVQKDLHPVAGTAIALTPDGSMFVFAARNLAGDATVQGYSLRDKRVTWTVTVPAKAIATHMAVHPAGDRAYVLYPDEHALAEIDIVEGRYVTAFAVDRTDGPLLLPRGMTLSPGGSNVVIPGLHQTNLVSTTTHQVTVIADYGRADPLGNGDFVGPRRTSLPVAIEYHHAAFDHYFVTSNAGEIEKLDAGEFEGWQRTGQTFKVFPTRTADTSPVLRFFSSQFAPKSTHFYTLRAWAWSTTLAPAWTYEGEPFYMAAPGLVDGACPAGTVPVYRYYNKGQGGAPNHRFVADPSARDAMLADGWLPEGYGNGVAMCGPQ